MNDLEIFYPNGYPAVSKKTYEQFIKCKLYNPITGRFYNDPIYGVWKGYVNRAAHYLTCHGITMGKKTKRDKETINFVQNQIDIIKSLQNKNKLNLDI